MKVEKLGFTLKLSISVDRSVLAFSNTRPYFKF